MNQELNPKVSIVLPTYNGAKYIRQSIDSCLTQTYGNIELIIVDDGSTDESPEIIKSYKDERVKYLRHDENKGLPHALNTGFAKATGEFLTWTSDDNYYAEEAIEKMLSFLRDKNCSFVYCDFYRFEDENPSNLNTIRLPDALALENHNKVGACFLYSRKVKESIGNYDPDTVLAEDYDYWIRVSKKFSMCHLNEPLYLYRIHEESLFRTRYYEIQIVALLVRMKNNVLDIPQATKLFINLIVEKNCASRFKLLTMAFLVIKHITFIRIRPSTLYRILVRIRFSNRVNSILRDFKTGEISFRNAKSELKSIVNNY